MLKQLLEKVVENDLLHAKWLNTLSYMENCGARKISKCEHPTNVDLIMLKHAAEEHRHAFYLKKMIGRLATESCTFYHNDELLGYRTTKHYLNLLDLYTARLLKEKLGLTGRRLQEVAYLFVTYVIEVRADELYPVYQDVLKASGSNVSVYTIIKEEEGHLEEMIAALDAFDPNWASLANELQAYEQTVYNKWLSAIQADVPMAVG